LINRVLTGFFISVVVLLMTMEGNAQDLTHFKENKSSVHGSVSATGIFYNSQGITPRKTPFSYILNGNLVVNLKGLVLPFSFTYSDRNKSFRQPFNQFGLSPKYKWITLHLGYRNINFSKYVLGGHTIFGAGVELTPGKFRFGAVYGRLRKNTNQATNVNNPLNDTITSFTRKVMSVKIGVGTKKTFVDLIIMRAADDSASLDPSAIETGNFPATNLVTGINSRIAFTKNIHLEMEGAYSIYTTNQSSKVSFDVPDIVTKIIPINLSSMGYLALRGLLEYRNRKGLKLGVAYRRIDPGYKSMGTYFINNDVENITFNTGFSAFNRKLRFSGSIGLERNNLNTTRNATTKKMIGSAMVSYDPVRIFGITINYSNYSINQQPGRIQIADSVKLYQSNGTFMVMPHFQFINSKNSISQFVSLVFSQMKLNDKNPTAGFNNSFTTLNNMLSYSITFIPVGLSVNTSFNYNKVSMMSGNSTNTGGTLGISKGFIKNKLSLGLAANLTQSVNAQQTMVVFTPTFTARAKIGKHHSFLLKANIISNNNVTNNNLSSTEQIGDFSYVFTF